RADAFCPTCFVALDRSRGRVAGGSTPIVTAHVCPGCSTRNPPAATRCATCGVPLPRSGAKELEDLADAPEDVALEEIAENTGSTQFDELVRCPLCGYENLSRAEFCGACWARLAPALSDAPTKLRVVIDEELAERWEVHGVKTGFVGRSRELATLCQLFDETVAGRLPQL